MYVSLYPSDEYLIYGTFDLFSHDEFPTRALFVHRFKYCVAAVSISELCIIYLLETMASHVEYECWIVMIFRLNDSMSRIFHFLVNNFILSIIIICL